MNIFDRQNDFIKNWDINYDIIKIKYWRLNYKFTYTRRDGFAICPIKSNAKTQFTNTPFLLESNLKSNPFLYTFPTRYTHIKPIKYSNDFIKTTSEINQTPSSALNACIYISIEKGVEYNRQIKRTQFNFLLKQSRKS